MFRAILFVIGQSFGVWPPLAIAIGLNVLDMNTGRFMFEHSAKVVGEILFCTLSFVSLIALSYFQYRRMFGGRFSLSIPATICCILGGVIGLVAAILYFAYVRNEIFILAATDVNKYTWLTQYSLFALASAACVTVAFQIDLELNRPELED